MAKKDFRKWALARVKRAMADYGMIAGGDRVAVGLSGGKDSGVLLYALDAVRRTTPVDFDLRGIFLDLGFGMDVTPVEEFCRRLGVPFRHEITDIGQIIFDVRNEKNPCALCSTLRRGALNDLALKLGCNKVALGHHLDDVVDTFFMSLLYNGQLRTFSPNTFMPSPELAEILTVAPGIPVTLPRISFITWSVVLFRSSLSLTLSCPRSELVAPKPPPPTLVITDSTSGIV